MKSAKTTTFANKLKNQRVVSWFMPQMTTGEVLSMSIQNHLTENRAQNLFTSMGVQKTPVKIYMGGKISRKSQFFQEKIKSTKDITATYLIK